MDTFLNAIAQQDAMFQVQTFGEPVEYRPFNGTPRTIQAVIDRKPLIQTSPRGMGRPQLRIMCTTDAVTGIDPLTADLDRDRIMVAYVAGQPPEAYGISKGDLNVQATGIFDAILT